MEADEGTSQDGEGQMDVLAAFVVNGETAEAVESGQCALDHPAIPSQALAQVHTAAGNPRYKERRRHSGRQR